MSYTELFYLYDDHGGNVRKCLPVNYIGLLNKALLGQPKYYNALHVDKLSDECKVLLKMYNNDLTSFLDCVIKNVEKQYVNIT